jgi:glucosamine 6-phosphate synthetase-like amidotransferase/phosphosugar isomerase protein
VQGALETVTAAIESSQRIMLNLRPAILEQGLVAALQWMAAQFERRTGIVCMLRAPAQLLSLAPGVPLVAYRAAQEALTNVSKHAQATEVSIDLSMAGGVLSLEVSDNGRGLGADDLAKAQDVLFLGRGAMYPLALEGALKLKEISYIHAEGYASGELKHGPIALIDAKVPVIVLAPRDALFDKTVSNMQEVMARHGKVLLISDAKGVDEAGKGVWRALKMPEAGIFAPILYAVPAQQLAYFTAIAKGTDVDQPRNLAKSVTVE